MLQIFIYGAPTVKKSWIRHCSPLISFETIFFIIIILHTELSTHYQYVSLNGRILQSWREIIHLYGVYLLQKKYGKSEWKKQWKNYLALKFKVETRRETTAI